MAGHIQDRWYRTETGPDGKTRKVTTDRRGVGLRYRARYVDPDGTEKSKSGALAACPAPNRVGDHGPVRRRRR